MFKSILTSFYRKHKTTPLPSHNDVVWFIFGYIWILLSISDSIFQFCFYVRNLPLCPLFCIFKLLARFLHFHRLRWRRPLNIVGGFLIFSPTKLKVILEYCRRVFNFSPTELKVILEYCRRILKHTNRKSSNIKKIQAMWKRIPAT